MNSASNFGRLFSVLVASCLFHAALGLIFFFDFNTDAINSDVKNWKKLNTQVALTVELLTNKDTDSPVPDKEKNSLVNRATEISPILLPEPKYYAINQLTKPPKSISEVKLDIPELISMAVSGAITLRLWINELGEVTRVDLEKSEVPKLITESAITSFRQLRFIPGQLNGRNVSSVMEIEIKYSDDDDQLTLPK